MDAAVKDLGVITALARDNGKWDEQHSKVSPRDMLTSLKSKRKRGRGIVLDAEAEEWLCGASALDGHRSITFVVQLIYFRRVHSISAPQTRSFILSKPKREMRRHKSKQ